MSKQTPPFLTAKKTGEVSVVASEAMEGVNLDRGKHSDKPAIFLGSSRSFSVCAHESKLIHDLGEL